MAKFHVFNTSTTYPQKLQYQLMPPRSWEIECGFQRHLFENIFHGDSSKIKQEKQKEKRSVLTWAVHSRYTWNTLI